MSELRQLHLRNALGATRTEMWDGREHLVVPVVALMEGVIHAVNARTAEFVSAGALARSVDKWNGHPLVIGHPVRDGRQISAHDPAVLAKHGCGFIRGTHMNGNRLGMEALVDPARMEALGHAQLLADLRAGKGCEVSVGSFVTTNDKKASYNGKAYDGEWLDLGPDHLAMLPGGTGACSQAMGCGMHRSAQAYLVTAEGFEALGDVEGHPFHGNQHTEGHGSLAKSDAGHKAETAHTKHESQEAASYHAGKAKELQDKRVASKAHEDAVEAHLKAVETGTKGDFIKANLASDHAHSIETKAKTTKVRNASMSRLKARILALFDTPEQAVSEEVSELIKYDTLRATHDALGDAWDEVDDLIDELIEAEAVHATGSGEEAETEIEAAKLDAIRTHCLSMSGSIGALLGLTYPSLASVEPARYAETLRTLVGKRNNASDAKMIQTMHDHAQALGAACDMANARFAAQKDCETCHGTGQIKEDDKQMDCPACDGEGSYKAAASAVNAESGIAAEGEDNMAKADKIKALTECSCSGFTAADVKALEGFDELRLDALIATGAARKKADDDLKASQAKTTETEAALKVAQAAQIPAEELTELRALGAERKAQDAASKADLITTLLTHSKVQTKEQLEARSLEDLRTLAAFANVEQPKDFSGRGIAVPRTAAAQDFTPPNPYDAGIKALQSVN